jgi:RNA polymerase sigma-70 factor (ECF subfamily)
MRAARTQKLCAPMLFLEFARILAGVVPSRPYSWCGEMVQKSVQPRDPGPSDVPSSHTSDHSLLHRFRSGNNQAATQLYLRYFPRLRALVKTRCSAELARRIDPDDIVQSVFHRFFRGVRRGHYDVPPGDELWRLFLVIALNKIRAEENYHRAGKRDVRLTVRDDACENAAAPDQPALAYLQLTVEEFLEKLTPAQRAVVELRIVGHGVAAIAREIGRSKRTVERILQEIRRKLTHLLPGGDEHGRQPS